MWLSRVLLGEVEASSVVVRGSHSGDEVCHHVPVLFRVLRLAFVEPFVYVTVKFWSWSCRSLHRPSSNLFHEIGFASRVVDIIFVNLSGQSVLGLCLLFGPGTSCLICGAYRIEV